MRPLPARQPPRRRSALRAAAGDLEPGLARAAALTGLAPARLAALPSALRAQISSDPTAVASSVLQLKAALPGADVAELLSRAPALLDPAAAAAACEAVPAARRLLTGGDVKVDGGERGDSGGASVDALIAAQPLLLTADLGEVVDEIQRLLPGAHPGDVLRRHPQLLLKLQRGSQSLGPGAEECSV